MGKIEDAIDNYNSVGRGVTVATLDASGDVVEIRISEPWKPGQGFSVASFVNEEKAVDWIIRKMAANGIKAARYSNL